MKDLKIRKEPSPNKVAYTAVAVIVLAGGALLLAIAGVAALVIYRQVTTFNEIMDTARYGL